MTTTDDAHAGSSVATAPPASPSAPVSLEPRLVLARSAPLAFQGMSAFSQSIDLDPVLHELVKLRASVLNGCAYCVDMHTTDARAAGETDRRLAAVASWHHAPFFTARERSALALTDALTRMSDHGVTDDVWAEATEYFDDAELAQLIAAIAAINSWNRIAVASLSAPPD